MFDYHIHSNVSFDGHDSPLSMALAARDCGLREICFTDHIDDDPAGIVQNQRFTLEEYSNAYDDLHVPGLHIRHGMEFGMLPDNRETVRRYLAGRSFDFVLGSLHYADGLDVYYTPYWENKDLFAGERKYLEDLLTCVQIHDDFDVLGHLTYISKAHSNPAHTPVDYETHREVIDEILKVLVSKGKGMEINSSGVDRCGDFLPPERMLRRFYELGGRIVTVGSDAHNAARVGQYMPKALELARDIFGHVCTFRQRQPVFHKL